MKRFLDKINFEDISQIIIGAAVMSVLVAFSEELWRFGKTLPPFNITLLVVLSFAIQFAYTYYSLFQGVEKRFNLIIFRVLLNYCLTFFTVAIVLFAINRFSISTDVLIGLKRIVVLSFPASLGAVIVDGFDKE